MSDEELIALIYRLSIRQNRQGIMDAIRSILAVAELEEAEHEIENALHVVGERRKLRVWTFLEWTPEGWREIT